MTRTLQDQLIKKGLATKNQVKTRKERKKERQKRFEATGFYSEKAIQEERRTKEIEELMGTRRPKYYRSKGSYRAR